MNLTEMLQNSGFKPEEVKEQAFILQGVYKCTFVKYEEKEDTGYGASILGKFKISETLKGQESKSKYPEFSQFFSLKPDEIANKKRGLAKLINGLFSVGVEVDQSSDEKFKESLTDALGSEVYINAFKKKKSIPGENQGEWIVTDEYKQDWTFLTEKDALKKVGSGNSESSSASSSSSL